MDKPQKLDALTSLRFFAAATIVLGHGDSFFGSIGLSETLPIGQGVSFFFVLSGFILAYNYPVLATWAEIGAFFKARFARIWPAHIAAIGILILLTSNMNIVGLSKGAAIFTGFANVFLFQSIIPFRDVFLAFNGVAWSISTEMFFYFAFPLLIAGTGFGWKSKLSLLTLIVVFCLWFAGAWAIPSSEAVSSSASLMGVIKVNPLVRMLEFFVGVLACTFFMHIRSSVNKSVVYFTVLEIATLMLMIFGMYISLNLSKFLGWQGEFANVIFYYFDKIGFFWFFALLIIIFAFGKGLLAKFLSLKPMILLGEISFSLYLVHTIVLKWYQINSEYFQNVPEWSKVAGYWLLSLVIAYLLHKIVENPCRKLILSFSKMNPREMFRIFLTGKQAIHVMLGMVIISAMISAPLYGPLLFKSEACPPNLCEAIANSHRLSTPAIFGDYVELTALRLSTMEKMGTGYSRLDFLFNVKTPLPAGYRLAIHLVDANGVIVSQVDSLLVKNRGLSKGEEWLQNIEIPTSWLKQGKSIGVVIYSDPNSPLTVTYPQTDFDGHRVLFNISQIYF